MDKEVETLGKHSIKRRDILETALILFKRKGFNQVGIDLIIEMASVAKMTFYKHFPSKMYLIECCLKEENRRIKKTILGLLNQDEKVVSISKLKLLYIWHIENKGCLFTRVNYEIMPTDTMLEIIRHHKKWKHDLIQQQLWGMGIKKEHPLSDLLYIVLEGLLVPIEQPIEQSKTWRMIENIIKSNE